MPVVRGGVRALAGASAVLLGLLVTEAQAQPGQPVIHINPDFSVTVSYAAPTPPPASGALLAATYNGAPIPGSPFNIGRYTTVTSPPMPLGDYTAQILWGVEASPVTAFTITAALGAPFLRAAAVDKTTVLVSWDPGTGVVSAYDIEAVFVGSGQIYSATLGLQTSLTVHNVFPGTYTVRIRARNAYGVGPWSNTITVTVGEVFALGDLQVTLTWNTTVDMDLHILEPDLTHVFYGNMHGRSARLDFDDIDGFGPENMFVSAGRATPGVYQVYIVHNSQNLETTSTVAVTLGAGTDTARTAIFTRRTRRGEPNRAVLVALVNVQTGELVEWIPPAGSDGTFEMTDISPKARD
jgi:hypothetical protein